MKNFRPPMEFTLTDQHVALLREAYVEWDDCETGAPCIDPKRPYGNSYVVGDLYELVHGTAPPEDEDIPDDEHERLMRLHEETMTALQIVLVTGSFTPGRYRRTDEYDRRSWVRADHN